MLQAQVNYWNYVEQKRHNIATELLTSAANEISQQQATAALTNAQTNRLGYYETVQHNRNSEQINMINAIASQTQAQAAVENTKIGWRNAEINAYNAQINYMNALTNQENAISNRIQANAATENAVSNRMQAQASQTQAAVAVGQLGINQVLAQSQIKLNESQIGLNKVKQIQGLVESKLTQVKTDTEIEKAIQASIDTDWYTVEKWLNSASTGTNSIKNLASAWAFVEPSQYVKNYAQTLNYLSSGSKKESNSDSGFMKWNSEVGNAVFKAILPSLLAGL